MKRHYDKNINDYGVFSEEKCQRKWEEAIDMVTPSIWRSVVQKIDRLIARDWKKEVNEDSDRTVYAGMVFSVGVSSDEESASEDEPVPLSPTGSLSPLARAKKRENRSPERKARQKRFARKDVATAPQKRIHRSLFDENRQVIK